MPPTLPSRATPEALADPDRAVQEGRLVRYAVRNLKKIRIRHVKSKKSESQVNGLILRLDVTVRSGTPQEIKRTIHTMRDHVQKEIEYTTGMSLETMKIDIVTGVAQD